MSEHHFTTVTISGPNAAAAANAVRTNEYFDGRGPEGTDAETSPDALGIFGRNSGLDAIAFIAELSGRFPTEQFDLAITGPAGVTTFQGTMTIQDRHFRNVVDYELGQEQRQWDDLTINEDGAVMAFLSGAHLMTDKELLAMCTSNVYEHDRMDVDEAVTIAQQIIQYVERILPPAPTPRRTVRTVRAVQSQPQANRRNHPGLNLRANLERMC